MAGPALTGHVYMAAAAALMVAACGVAAAWGMHVYVAGRLATDVAVGDTTADACASGYVENESAAGRVLGSMDGTPCQVLRAANATLGFTHALALTVVGLLVLLVMKKTGALQDKLGWAVIASVAVAVLYMVPGESTHVAILSSQCREASDAELGVATTGLVLSVVATALVAAFAFTAAALKLTAENEDLVKQYHEFNTNLLVRAGAVVAIAAAVSRIVTYPLSRRLREATRDYVRSLSALSTPGSCMVRKQMQSTYACVDARDRRADLVACSAAVGRRGAAEAKCTADADGAALYALHQPGLPPFAGEKEGNLRELRRARHLPDAAKTYATGIGATMIIAGIVGGIATGAFA